MNSLIGPETAKALTNFDLSAEPVSRELIYAIVLIKKAAADAHINIGSFVPSLGKAIMHACDEVLDKKHDGAFVISSIQGGAGTSINMNVNEVIASRASMIAGEPIHPLNHVNLHQSTNDVNPSALRLVCIDKLHLLIEALDTTRSECRRLSTVHKATPRLAHTHLQDAVPSTYSELFASYEAILHRHRARLTQIVPLFYELSLGGCAIGNGKGGNEAFTIALFQSLSRATNKKLQRSANPMSFTNSAGDFAHLSSLVHILMLDLSKIATDIRFLSSGPRGGIGEVVLANLQAGSSIMPGKVNPVIPEMINQVFYTISGNHTALIHAAEQSHLDLALMFPVIAQSIIESLSLSKRALELFTALCLHSLIIQKKVAETHLNESTACAALFVEKLGYDTMARIVHESIQTHTPLRELLARQGLVTKDEYDRIVGIEFTDKEQ